MRQLLTLHGAYKGKKVRRLAKTGRVELLRCFFDPEEIMQIDYYFVRILGFNELRDRPRLIRCGSNFGNGYFRFAQLEPTQAKFSQLAAQPETLAEAKQAEIDSIKRSERSRKYGAKGRAALQKWILEKKQSKPQAA